MVAAAAGGEQSSVVNAGVTWRFIKPSSGDTGGEPSTSAPLRPSVLPAGETRGGWERRMALGSGDMQNPLGSAARALAFWLRPFDSRLVSALVALWWAGLTRIRALPDAPPPPPPPSPDAAAARERPADLVWRVTRSRSGVISAGSAE